MRDLLNACSTLLLNIHAVEQKLLFQLLLFNVIAVVASLCKTLKINLLMYASQRDFNMI